MEHSPPALCLPDGGPQHLPNRLSDVPSTTDKVAGDTGAGTGLLPSPGCTGYHTFLVRSEVQIR